MDPKKLKAYLKRLHKLSDEDTEKKFSALSEDEKKELSAKLADEQAQFKAHLTGAGLSEKEADEKLSKMSDEDTEKMSAILAAKLASDDEQKKLAEEHDKLKKQLAEKDADGDYDGDKKLKARLAATKGKVLELFAGAEKLSGETRLAALKTSITVRLARLQSEGKITPAERKKIDIAQLAAKGAGVVEERLQSYADREPVIHMGQLGSVTALSVGTLTKKEAKQLAAARIEEESRKNLGMKPDGENVKLLSAIPKGVKLEEGAPKTEAPTHMKHLEQHLANIEKCASEGNVKDLVAHCDALRKALTEMAFPTPGGEGAEKQMSELSAQVEKLVTELAGMKAKVTELIA